MFQQSTLAERVTFGRPVEPVIDDTALPVAARPTTVLVGRVLMSIIFVVAGLGKLIDPAGTAAYMTAAGVPAAYALAVVAGLVEVVGGLSLAFGAVARLGALVLLLYLIPVTLVMHAFWGLDAAQTQAQLVQFMKNLAIMGGLAMVFASGPGRYSIDRKIRRPMQP